MNKYTWNIKKRLWKNKFTIVTPSHWLSQCARDSLLFRGWDIYTIPNALNTDVFKPINKIVARKILNLPLDKKLIGFGAMGGTSDVNKGFDLLRASLNKLSNFNFQCVVFGQSKALVIDNVDINYLGKLTDEVALVLFYNAIDVMVVPSRQENLPQTATESQSCGTPVVAFNTTGLPDVIIHKVTGYLVKPFDTDDLAFGIRWCIDNPDNVNFVANSRDRALKYWSYPVISKKHRDLYKKLLNY